jgi:hypothetical protein
MSPLAKEIIERLYKEQDIQVLAEVLDFYDYLKQKKEKENKRVWETITEDDPTDEERKIIQQYKNLKEELIPLDDLITELNLDE